MAAALLRRASADGVIVDSAGLHEGGLDPFVEIVMAELDVSMHDHAPKSINDVDIAAFDRIITLTPEAALAMRAEFPDASIEFWDIENPSDERGGRDAVVDAYRRVRNELSARLRERFPESREIP